MSGKGAWLYCVLHRRHFEELLQDALLLSEWRELAWHVCFLITTVHDIRDDTACPSEGSCGWWKHRAGHSHLTVSRGLVLRLQFCIFHQVRILVGRPFKQHVEGFCQVAVLNRLRPQVRHVFLEARLAHRGRWEPPSVEQEVSRDGNWITWHADRGAAVDTVAYHR